MRPRIQRQWPGPGKRKEYLLRLPGLFRAGRTDEAEITTAVRPQESASHPVELRPVVDDATQAG